VFGDAQKEEAMESLAVLRERILLTVPEAAEALSVSRATLYVMIGAGQLPTVRVGSRGVRIPVDALREFARSQQKVTQAV
jgi:excisionase family DNA binding protein